VLADELDCGVVSGEVLGDGEEGRGMRGIDILRPRYSTLSWLYMNGARMEPEWSGDL
jgi:hypothetical protein